MKKNKNIANNKTKKNNNSKTRKKGQRNVLIKNVSLHMEKCKSYFKKLSLKNYFNIGLLLLLIISSASLFFYYKMVFFPDSKHYYTMSKIILGDIGISHWQTVRGFGFPLIGASWILLFGDTPKGVLTGAYIYYLILVLLIGYLLQRFMKKNEVQNRLTYIILFVLLVPFNTLIIGYSHTFLTESVMPTFYLITIFLLFKWYRLDYKQAKKKIIFLNIAFVLLGIMTWFIKQPFAPAFYIGLIISAICSGIHFKSWKMFGKKMSTVLICLVFMLISIFSWNRLLEQNTKKSANDINDSFMTNSILSGMNVYYYSIPKEEYCNVKYIKKLKISEKEKKKILDIRQSDKKHWCDHLLVYDLREHNGDLVTNEVLISSDRNITSLETLGFLFKNYFKHPTYVFRSYYYNYLAISDIQERDFSNGYRSSLNNFRHVYGENFSNGTYPFETNVATLGFYSNGLMDNYASKTPNNSKLTEIMMMHGEICLYLYKILTLFALPIFIYTFIKYIILKDTNYFITSLISMMHFTNAMFNVFAGAIIDRYVYPTYPAMLLCLLILMMSKKKRSDKDEIKR